MTRKLGKHDFLFFFSKFSARRLPPPNLVIQKHCMGHLCVIPSIFRTYWYQFYENRTKIERILIFFLKYPYPPIFAILPCIFMISEVFFKISLCENLRGYLQIVGTYAFGGTNTFRITYQKRLRGWLK